MSPEISQGVVMEKLENCTLAGVIWKSSCSDEKTAAQVENTGRFPNFIIDKLKENNAQFHKISRNWNSLLIVKLFPELFITEEIKCAQAVFRAVIYMSEKTLKTLKDRGEEFRFEGTSLILRGATWSNIFLKNEHCILIECHHGKIGYKNRTRDKSEEML